MEICNGGEVVFSALRGERVKLYMDLPSAAASHIGLWLASLHCSTIEAY